jgi:hypothetical protein
MAPVPETTAVTGIPDSSTLGSSEAERPATIATDALALWTLIYGPDPGILAIWSGTRATPDAKDLTSPQTAYFAWPADTVRAVAEVARQDAAGREAYHACHLLTHKRRIKENAAPVWTLWCEIDQATATIPPHLRPTAQVASGSPGHTHDYWRLTRAIPPRNAERLNQALARAVGADPSGYDLSQLLRPPGSHNHKHADPVPVELLWCDAERAYDPADLEQALADFMPRPTASAPTVDGAPDDGPDAPPVRLHGDALTRWRGELVEHKDAGELDRSNSLFFLGLALAEANATAPTITRALTDRDDALGWRKYTGRGDAAQRYGEISAKAVAYATAPSFDDGAVPDDDQEHGGAWVPRAWLDKEREDHAATRADLRAANAENAELKRQIPEQLAPRVARAVMQWETDRTTRGQTAVFTQLWSEQHARPDAPIPWCNKTRAKQFGWEKNAARMGTLVQRAALRGVLLRSERKRGCRRGDYRVEQSVEVVPELRALDLPEFLETVQRRLKDAVTPRQESPRKVRVPCACNADRCPNDPDHTLVATIARTCETCGIQVTAPHDHAPQAPVQRTVLPVVQWRRSATADLTCRPSEQEKLTPTYLETSASENLSHSPTPAQLEAAGVALEAIAAAARRLPPAEFVAHRTRWLDITAVIARVAPDQLAALPALAATELAPVAGVA